MQNNLFGISQSSSSGGGIFNNPGALPQNSGPISGGGGFLGQAAPTGNIFQNQQPTGTVNNPLQQSQPPSIFANAQQPNPNPTNPLNPAPSGGLFSGTQGASPFSNLAAPPTATQPNTGFLSGQNNGLQMTGGQTGLGVGGLFPQSNSQTNMFAQQSTQSALPGAQPPQTAAPTSTILFPSQQGQTNPPLQTVPPAQPTAQATNQPNAAPTTTWMQPPAQQQPAAQPQAAATQPPPATQPPFSTQPPPATQPNPLTQPPPASQPSPLTQPPTTTQPPPANPLLTSLTSQPPSLTLQPPSTQPPSQPPAASLQSTTAPKPAAPAQPAPKIDKPQQKNCDFYSVRERINKRDELYIQQYLNSDPVLGKILFQGSKWFDFSQTDVTHPQDTPFDQEVRNLCFGNKIKSDVYQVLMSTIQNHHVKAAEDLFKKKDKIKDQYEKDFKKFRHALFNHYAEQRSLLASSLKLLIVSNILEDELMAQPIGVVCQMLSKDLVKNMVVAYDGSAKALKQYLNEHLSEESKFSSFRHFVQEQIHILETIAIIHSHFNLEAKLMEPVKDIIKNLQVTNFQGMFFQNSDLIFQEKRIQAAALLDEFRTVSFMFVMILATQPISSTNPRVPIANFQEILQLDSDSYGNAIKSKLQVLPSTQDPEQVYENSLGLFKEQLIQFQRIEINYHFLKSSYYSIHVWIREKLSQDNVFQEEPEVLSKIYSIILQLSPMWELFRYGFFQQDMEQQIFFKFNIFKVLRKIKQLDTLEFIQDNNDLITNIFNQLKDFAESQLSNKIWKNSDFIGRHSKASMDFYHQYNKQKGIEHSINISNLAPKIVAFKYTIKYLRSEMAKNVNSIKIISNYADSKNFNSNIIKIPSECQRLIELIIDTKDQNSQIFSIVSQILSIGSEAVEIINLLLQDPTEQTDFASQIEQITSSKQYLYHQLFELFHIARRFQASSQFKNNQVTKLYLSYAKLCSIVIDSSLFKEQFIKNNLETFFKYQLQEWRNYEEDREPIALELQSQMFLTLQRILQKFLFHQPLDFKDTSLHQLIKQKLEEINSQQILEFMRSPLFVNLSDCFFEEVGQKNMSELVIQIGIKNTLHEQQKQNRLLETKVNELLIRCLECWNALIDLYSIQKDEFSNNLSLVKSARLFFEEESYFMSHMANTYQNDAGTYQNHKVRLNFVHALFGMLSIESDILPGPQPPDFEDESQQQFKDLYDYLRIPNYRQILDRNTPLGTTVFSSALRLLSKPLFKKNLENHITTVQIEDSQTKNQHYHHLIFQALHTILFRLSASDNISDKQEILEFLIISLHNNQTFMQYLLKAQKPHSTRGIQYFLSYFDKLLDPNQIIDYHLISLVFVLFYQILCVHGAKYQQFANVCNTQSANILQELCRDATLPLSNRCEKLGQLLKIQGSKEYLLKDSGTALEQVVIEECLMDAINQMVAVEYLLKIILHEIKQDVKETQVAYQKEVIKMFKKSFIRDWFLELIRFSDFVKQDRIAKRESMVEDKQIYRYLANYIYSYGRDFQIDSNTIHYLKKQNVIQIQRQNIMASWYIQQLATLEQLSQFIQFFFSIGPHGSPFSQIIDKYEQQEIGDSIWAPNINRVIIKGGIIELFAQEHNSQSREDYAQNFVLHTLELSLKEIYVLNTPIIYEELFIPIIETVNQLYNWFLQVQITPDVASRIRKQTPQHQMSFYKRLLDMKWICRDETKKGVFKRTLFSTLNSMLLMYKSVKEEVLPEPTDTVSVFQGLLLKIDFNESNSAELIGQLSSILSILLDIFPQNIELLNKPHNGNYDITNLQIEVLKTTQNPRIFSQIAQCWMDIVVRQVSKRIDVRYLKQLLFISDEKIYDQSSKYNLKHAIWCHVLILVREILAYDTNQCRTILEFITQHEQRLHSCIVQIDQTQQYQQLRQFTTVTGLTLKQVHSQPQSLMFYFELNQITQLFIQILLTKQIRMDYALNLDKIIYTFIGQYNQQLGYHRKFKLFIQTFKPQTELENKLHQVFPKLDKKSDNINPHRQQSSPSPNRPKGEQTSQFDGRSTIGGQQRVIVKREVDSISCFQYICLVEFLKTQHFAIQGIVASMNILDIDRNFQLEDNVINNFGDNLQGFIIFNLETITNMQQLEQLENHIILHQSLIQNYDFQMQYNGMQLLCDYPKNKEEFLLICVKNIIYAFCAELQYLQLRDVYRKTNYSKDSHNLEIQLILNLCKYVSTLMSYHYLQGGIADKFKDTIPLGDDHLSSAEDSYFNKWKLKFEEKLKEYQGS